jgi:hypothetical protein
MSGCACAVPARRKAAPQASAATRSLDSECIVVIVDPLVEIRFSTKKISLFSGNFHASGRPRGRAARHRRPPRRG